MKTLKTVFTGDNLPVMRGMNSDSVDLIYLDPPFNSNANYAAPIGSKAAGAEFKDTWNLSDVDVAWIDLIEARHPALNRVIQAALNNSDKSYLVYMAVRLLEMKRILKPTGSIYLHCDPTMSHYLKLVMDAIFGRRNFRNEIVWKRTSSHNRAKRWGPVHDILLFYGGSLWNRVLEPLDQSYVDRFYRHSDNHGRYRVSDLTGPGTRDGDTGQRWREIDPSERGRHWEVPPDRALPEWFVFPENYESLPARQRLDVLDSQGLIYWPPQGSIPSFKRYLTEKSGQPVNDVILDILPLATGAQERLGYPTQKPLKLLERVIKASSNEGDVVFDPFCGCATTLVAADILNRNWIGIDISPKAVELVTHRIKKHQGLFRDIVARKDVPKRTDVTVLRPYNSAENKKLLYGEQAGHCNGCGTHFEMRNLTIDHIIARSVGGTDDIENLQLLCGNCNSVKGNRGQEYLLAKLEGRKVAYG